MREVSQEFKDAFLSGGQKELRLEWEDNSITTNELISAESMYFEQSISETDELRFGKVNSSIFKVQIFDLTPRRNMRFTAKISAGEYSYTIGTFYVQGDKLADDRKSRNIVAYDALYKALNMDMKGFYLAFFQKNMQPTIKNFRDEVFKWWGIQQETKTLINDSFLLKKDENISSLSGRDLLEGICEFNATFGYIDNENVFRYMVLDEQYGLYPRRDLYPNPNLYPQRPASESFSDFEDNPNNSYYLGSCVWEEYPLKTIRGLAIESKPFLISDEQYILVNSELSSGDTYSLKNTYIIYGYNQGEENYVLDLALDKTLKSFRMPSFYAGKFKTRGRVWLELGDWVRVVTRQGAFSFPIMHRTMSGISGLIDEYECATKENYSFNPVANRLGTYTHLQGEADVWMFTIARIYY